MSRVFGVVAMQCDESLAAWSLGQVRGFGRVRGALGRGTGNRVCPRGAVQVGKDTGNGVWASFVGRVLQDTGNGVCGVTVWVRSVGESVPGFRRESVCTLDGTGNWVCGATVCRSRVVRRGNACSGNAGGEQGR